MPVAENIEQASALMQGFAERTGIGSAVSPRRYLWTDAFAVCNFLGLARATDDSRWLALARALVDQVHHVLGRHREGGGWLSGLGEAEGARHPTVAGLRIGKPLPERQIDDPYDEVLEWERDGQYFHYLTRWMHALDQMAWQTGDPRFDLWARELAIAAHRGFTRGSDGGRRMIWKASVDLSRALVAATGQHDPLDGYITCIQLETTPPLSPTAPDLGAAARDLASMFREPRTWVTSDTLGLGSLMLDAHRVDRLHVHAAFSDDRMLVSLLAAALAGMRAHRWDVELREPATRRLAFRELGLAIGLRALRTIEPRRDEVRELLELLRGHVVLASTLVEYWRAPEQHQSLAWLDHRDIDEVMLATALAPEGYLLPPVPARARG